MKRIVLTVVAIVALLIAGMAYRVWPREETQYAHGFDRTAFARLQFGATMDGVRRSLGDPLARREISSAETWMYCLRDPEPVTTGHGLFTTRTEMPLSCPEVELDALRRVTAVRGWAGANVAGLLGGDAATARARLGEPRVIRNAGHYTIWYYSGPAKPDRGFEQYSVTFDDRAHLVDRDVTQMPD